MPLSSPLIQKNVQIPVKNANHLWQTKKEKSPNFLLWNCGETQIHQKTIHPRNAALLLWFKKQHANTSKKNYEKTNQWNWPHFCTKWLNDGFKNAAHTNKWASWSWRLLLKKWQNARAVNQAPGYICMYIYICIYAYHMHIHISVYM